MSHTEQPHESVAAEVRAQLARRRISGRRAALTMGWTEHYMSRRLTGKTPLDVNDLAAIAAVLNVPISTFIAPLDSGYAPSRKGADSVSVNSP
ncbi:helix-turn-helix domain-containing protein [Actinomadura violacea]|uniref:Helix-turn-helix transcriptional regulator n=1 Tax=Actinomadura violacea TaxID=2819934 RepID=A0ABS3RRK1_9ACTN|nr:helix-turn-helix transcriptional regulator [Actinomadura violacea]MBO2459357.1 helix-turn-helix transcriptional regulator [Actinomadura violacea]